jgi:O-antigen ligase
MVNRIALTLVFTLSFLTYMLPELSTSVQLAPLALFASLVFFKVIWSHSVIGSVSSLFEADGLLFVLFVSILILAPSFASRSDNSLGASFAIVICIVLGRIYMAIVPVLELLDAFFLAGVITVGLFLPLAFASLQQSIETLARFSPFSFHPNLLAFVLAGYFCAMVWKFLTSGLWMRILSALIGLICLLIIFLASSRGSILGIVCGCLVAAVMSIIRAKKEGRIRLRGIALVATLFVLGFVALLQSSAWFDDVYSYTDQALAITDSDRGIDSGFTGRFATWDSSLRSLADGSWVFGHGIRASDTLGQFIDNSYLVLLYEAGIIPLVLITWRFLFISERFVRGYFQSLEPRQQLLYLSLVMMVVAFMVNNIVARYLLSVGNAYSLVMLLLFVTPSFRLVPSAPLSRAQEMPVAKALELRVDVSA